MTKKQSTNASVAPKALQSKVSRRAVAALAAWSVPVIVASQTLPAFAASEPPVTVVWLEPIVHVPSRTSRTVTAVVVGDGAVSGQQLVVSVSEGFTVVESGGLAHTVITTAAGTATVNITARGGASDGVVTVRMVGARANPVTAKLISGTIVADERSGSSRVFVRATISADEARSKENRWFSHNDYQPTGRFVRAGQKLQLTQSAPGMVSLAVGLYGTYDVLRLNDGRDVQVSPLAGSETGGEVAAPHDGMVFVRSYSSSPHVVTVTGGESVPTFVLGETSTAELSEQLGARPSAPFVTVVSEHMYGDFQRATIEHSVDNVESAAANWDFAVTHTNRVYGLSSAVSGIAHRHAHRIYIANPDSGAGWASATDHRITFQVDTGAGKSLFESPQKNDNWGLWHEIGHTYQTLQYKWDGLTEVSVNISALAVQEATGAPSRLDTADYQQKLRAFRSTPEEQRDYDTINDLFVKLLMFDQLRRAFGEGFYPRLSQEYRVRTELSEAIGDQRQTFMRLSALVANRDLRPFYRAWGLRPDAQTEKQLASYPALEAAIWDNHNRATDARISSVGEYTVPVATVSATSSTLTLGQTQPPTLRVTQLRNSDGSPTASLQTAVAFFTGTPLKAHAVAVLTNTSNVRNAYKIDQTFAYGTCLDIRGYGDASCLWLALHPDNTLRAGTAATSVHWVFNGRLYFAVTISPPDAAPTRHVALGDTNPASLVEHLDNTALPDGTIIEIEHQEPAGRLIWWSNNARQPASSNTVQRYLIQSGTLSRI